MAAAAIPLLTAGIGAAGSLFAGKKVADATRKASLFRSPEEQQYQSALTALTRQQTQQGADLYSRALPVLTQAGDYQARLLRGNPADLAELTGGERALTRQSYAGADRAVERSGLRGMARDRALASNKQALAGSLSMLTKGIRGQAAGALQNLGTSMLYPAITASASAASGLGQLVGLEGQRSMGAAQAGQQAGAATTETLGGLLAQLLKYLPAKSE